jgi:uncharacterized membrane protein YhaH (DUF805 family)
MASKADRRRRWTGVIFLLAALGMLVAGETVLRNRLHGLGFVIFWLVCFLFTCLAMLVAFWDVAVTRRRVREEQREFLENTLREIAHRKQVKSPTRPGRSDDAR